MSTEPVTMSKAGSASAKLDGAAAARPMPPKGKIDPRYYAPLFISFVVISSHLVLAWKGSGGVLVSPLYTLAAIFTALATEAILGRIVYGKIPHLASAYVSGISVGILVRAEDWWPFVICSALSIASKYALRVKDRHLWNPSNFGITAMLILAAGTPAFHTLTIQFGNSLGPMVVIWLLGSFIIWKLKRFHICATYVAAFTLFALLRTLNTGDRFVTEWAPITGPLYQLYTFFMITDPKTTVKSKKGQMIVGFCVAAMEHILRVQQNIHAPYFALFIVGPLANAIEVYLDSKKRPAAAKPAPAPA
jgi:Na+-transporting NADH:ubiquinone oxidoreductase subunit NqrB